MNFSIYNGIQQNKLKRISERSRYNLNYYEPLEYDYDESIIYAESDDDNRTTYYYQDRNGYIEFAESFCSKGNILHVYSEFIK